MSIDYIFTIYTHKKNIPHADTMYNRYLNNSVITDTLKMKVLIIYGDDTIEDEYTLIDDKYLVLRVDDGYQSLYMKTLALFKAVYTLYPRIIGCFKCDDDIIINIKSLEFFIASLSKFSINYSGTSCMVHEKEDNNLHLLTNNKKEQMENMKSKINTPAALYCGGPLYYVSSYALSILRDADAESMKHIYYEDLIVGYVLNSRSIYPIQSNLYSDDITMYSKNTVFSSFHNTEKKKSVFIRIQGGLGNQLFEIASAYGVAQKNNMNLFIINNSSMKHQFTHIDDNNYLLNTIFRPFQTIEFDNINLQGIQYYKENENKCFSYDDISTSQDIMLDGYFQNEKYFLPYKDVLISMFTSNMVYLGFMQNISNNSQLLNSLRNSYFIHVRRGDYLKHKDIYEIDYETYYKKAIAYIIKKDSSAHFFILSDDIEYCKTYKPFSSIKKTCIDMPPLETIYFMSHCQKGGICCNSTFSWWGSYLNRNPNKIVTFPSKWINKNWSNDIYYNGSTVI